MQGTHVPGEWDWALLKLNDPLNSIDNNFQRCGAFKNLAATEDDAFFRIASSSGQFA
jgi:hypothetical protein